MTTNVFAALPANLAEELFTPLLQTTGIRIERIVSHGHQSPDGFWHDQPSGEWMIVLEGAVRIDFEGHAVEIGPNDYVDIPARTEHRVARTTPDEPTIRLALGRIKDSSKALQTCQAHLTTLKADLELARKAWIAG